MCSRERNNAQPNLFMMHVSAFFAHSDALKRVGWLRSALTETRFAPHTKYQETGINYFSGTLYVPLIAARLKATAWMLGKVGFEYAVFIQTSTRQVLIRWNQPSRSLSATRVETA